MKNNSSPVSVLELLKDNRIKEACNFVRNNIENLKQKIGNRSELSSISNFYRQLSNIENNYRYLLDYMAKGFEDPSRPKMINDLKSGILRLNDAVIREIDMTDSDKLYYRIRRFENLKGHDLSFHLHQLEETGNNCNLNEKEQKIAIEKVYKDIFNYIWTLFFASEDDYRLLKETLFSEKTSRELKYQLITAILLANLEFFDSKSLEILFDLYEAEVSSQLSARSLTAIFLIIFSNPERLIFENRIISRMQLWQDSVVVYTQLRDILINIVKTRETQQISEKVENELMPELLKHREEILDKLQDNKEFYESDGEYNPDWEEMIEKSGIGEKLRELTEIQMEGADLMMLTFKNLKDFPFFRDISNWFLPFSFNHSSLIDDEHSFPDSLKSLFDMEGIICNSDKYSFALSLMRLGPSQREMLSHQMEGQMEQLKEILSENKDRSSNPSFHSEMIVYIRDLYRFFKLFSRKNEFNDPMEKDMKFYEMPYIKEILDETEILRIISEFYFNKNYYKDAIDIYKYLDSIQEADPMIWERIGYSYLKLKQPEEALKWFSKADLLNPESKWLWRQMAYTLRVTGQYNDAFNYYQKLSQSFPDEINYIINMGRCKMKTGNYEEALPHFYHANYIEPDNYDILRWIARTEMMSRNFEKSKKYYFQIIDSGLAVAEDFLNLGHVFYFLKNYEEVVSSYRKYLSLSHGNIDQFRQALHRDCHKLRSLEMDETELRLLADKAEYEGFQN